MFNKILKVQNNKLSLSIKKVLVFYIYLVKTKNYLICNSF